MFGIPSVMKTPKLVAQVTPLAGLFIGFVIARIHFSSALLITILYLTSVVIGQGRLEVTPVTQQNEDLLLENEKCRVNYYLNRGLEGLRIGAFHPDEVALIIAQLPILATMLSDPDVPREAYLTAIHDQFDFTKSCSGEFKTVVWGHANKCKTQALSQLENLKLHQEVADIVAKELKWLRPSNTIYQPYLDALLVLVKSEKSEK
jgi:hypothetical protein